MLSFGVTLVTILVSFDDEGAIAIVSGGSDVVVSRLSDVSDERVCKLSDVTKGVFPCSATWAGKAESVENELFSEGCTESETTGNGNEAVVTSSAAAGVTSVLETVVVAASVESATTTLVSVVTVDVVEVVTVERRIRPKAWFQEWMPKRETNITLCQRELLVYVLLINFIWKPVTRFLFYERRRQNKKYIILTNSI